MTNIRWKNAEERGSDLSQCEGVLILGDAFGLEDFTLSLLRRLESDGSVRV